MRLVLFILQCHCTVRSHSFSFNNGTNTELSPSCSVFDLPQLYSRPPAYVLLQALESLAVKPISWDSAIENDEEEEDEISEDGIPRYLTGIIKSPLAWIENEVEKEQIWESASMRLSERSGRTGESLFHASSDALFRHV